MKLIYGEGRQAAFGPYLIFRTTRYQKGHNLPNGGAPPVIDDNTVRVHRRMSMYSGYSDPSVTLPPAQLDAVQAVVKRVTEGLSGRWRDEARAGV